MLGPGDRVPDVHVWTAPGKEPETLVAILGEGLTLLCFYVFDFSPT